MMSDERVNSFEDIGDLNDLKPKTVAPKKASKQVIDAIAKSTGFTSRQSKPNKIKTSNEDIGKPAPRRTRIKTGRNLQLNIKVTEVAITNFYALADEMVEPLGEVFEQAVNALMAKRRISKK